MYILDQLWSEDIHPRESFRRGSRLEAAASKLADTEKKLRGSLPADLLPLLDEFEKTHWEVEGLEEMEGFIRGFQLGARIVLDILNDNTSLPSRS